MLFAQIELLAKPTGNFGELRLALVIELRTLADEGGIPSHTRWLITATPALSHSGCSRSSAVIILSSSAAVFADF